MLSLSISTAHTVKKNIWNVKKKFNIIYITIVIYFIQKRNVLVQN